MGGGGGGGGGVFFRAGGTLLRPPLPKTGGATPRDLPANTRFFFFLRGCIAATRLLLLPGVLWLLPSLRATKRFAAVRALLVAVLRWYARCLLSVS